MTNEYNPDGKEIRFIDSHYKDLFHIQPCEKESFP